MYQLCVDEGNGTPFRVLALRSDEGLALKRQLLSLSRHSITLINTQLIHQFVFRHADAVNLVLLRAGITHIIKNLAYYYVQLENLFRLSNIDFPQ